MLLAKEPNENNYQQHVRSIRQLKKTNAFTDEIKK